MTMCLGKEKLEHIMQCKVCQERMNYVLTGGTASKAVRTFKKIKKEEIRVLVILLTLIMEDFVLELMLVTWEEE